MNEEKEKNLWYLERQIEMTGFGDTLKGDLRALAAKGKKEFSIEFEKQIGADKVDGKLNFGTSEKGNLYIGSFDMNLMKEGQEEVWGNNFRVFMGNNFTLKEAYNLLDGRSVHKNFIKVNDFKDWTKNEEQPAWTFMDFKNTNEEGNYLLRRIYNFDLKESLDKLPIKGWQFDNRKVEIMENLKKGNYQMVTLEIDGKEEKRFIEAVPRFQSINIYDENMQRDYLTKGREQSQEQSQQQGKQASNKQQNTKASKQASGKSTGKQAGKKTAQETKTAKVGRPAKKPVRKVG